MGNGAHVVGLGAPTADSKMVKRTVKVDVAAADWSPTTSGLALADVPLLCGPEFPEAALNAPSSTTIFGNSGFVVVEGKSLPFSMAGIFKSWGSLAR